MEEEDTRDYSEPCVQCSVVNWGLTDEGRFYCKSCHNVIERTKEVLTSDVVPNTKIQSISRGFRKRKKIDKGWEWYVCEGFQYILKKQAEALQTLGVCPQMKDEILCNFWRLYLQKSSQAYCTTPASYTSKALSISDVSTDVESEPERISIHGLSPFSESDGDLQTESSFGHVSSIGKASETSSVCSGSVDGDSYLLKRKKGNLRMSMPMTLSFCYIALLWLREPVTLSDLLRFVTEGHIPYLNAFQCFPEEMKLYGADLKIFRVESWPVYEDVHNKMSELSAFLDLPCFPAITDSCFLHPNILCIKYLMEANLPDELHNWTCRVVKKINVGETDFLTLDPVNKSARKVKYDVLAAAIIIVWYKVIKKSVDVEQKKLDEERARCLWKCEKPLFYSSKEKSVVLKKRQMVVNLQRQFGTLSGSMQVAEKQSPSSFQLNWAEENTDSNCFHGHILEGILQEKGNSLTAMNTKYWLCSVKLCNEKICGQLTHYKESDFPQSYQFVLNLFSFLLRVPASLIHEEVCLIEHKLFKTKRHRNPKDHRATRW
uniref:TATA box-binding protein-associated factor RNA polymerase I subunit B n=1 Tax=Chelonoidis abingdonii TaxID=106734 RepID=A0A8C0QR81_CHEAB